MVKNLFDYAKQKDQGNVGGPSELIIDEMDEEQIWQQLELQNESLWSKCLRETSKLLSLKDDALSVKFKVAGEAEETASEGEGEEDDDDDAEGEEDEDVSDEEQSIDDEDEEEVDDEDDDENSPTTSKRKGRKSIVDDSFFKLSEMEDFLEAEDRKEMRKTSGGAKQVDNDSDDDGIDYFKADDDDEDGDSAADENYKYKAFFGKGKQNEEWKDGEKRRALLADKNKKSVKRKQEDLGLENSDIDDYDDDDDEIEEASDDGDDEDKGDTSGKVKFDLSKNTYRSDSEDSVGENDRRATSPNPPELDPSEMSTFEHRQERLRMRIQDMEEQAMGEKSWQLRGEIDSTSRPQNSLLEEVLEYDSTVRPAPVITEATTMQLEDIIRQRIKDKAWNDVERKYKPTATPQEFRKKLVLDQEKSKESLAQIYEKEYLREVDKLDPTAGDRAEEEPKEHREIRAQMTDLFLKLDALSNFFYTPKPAQAEAKIITNVPAISMEEVAPLAVSDAQLLAPEEVSGKQKGAGDLLGKTERTRTDKNRERRQKKMLQRQKQVAKEKRDAAAAAAGISRSSKEDKKRLLDKVSKSRNVQKVLAFFCFV